VTLSVGELFAGIGGIGIGLERAGMRVAWQCEIDPFCRSVLARHYPGVPCYHDVRSIDDTTPKVDVLAGGFPCQPVSQAGRRLAQADERWLWPAFARAIRILRPRYVVVENVPGLLARGMGDVLGDLAALGFDAEWTVFGARDVGAPHRRDRVWIVAWRPDADGDGQQGEPERDERPAAGEPAPLGDDADGLRLAVADATRGGRRAVERYLPEREPDADRRGAVMADADGARLEGPGREHRLREAVERAGRRSESAVGGGWAVEPDVGRVAYGIPARVDRLRALGNAVVPQCAEHVRWIVRHAVSDAETRDAPGRVIRRPGASPR
jgi:DNA (cytosine-5)-methyltransferase 1